MMSSVNHDDFAHFKIPLEDVLSATSNFDNLVGTTGANFYRGQLLWSSELINILAERLNKKWLDGDQQFWTEVLLLSSLKHKNMLSFVGFCDDNDEKVIIYKRETRGSLISYLSDSMSLTWVRRLEISVGIAHALSYIHYDESRDFSVIHRNINSGSVYLNNDWEPKLGDFIGSMKIKAFERHQSFNTDEVWISTDGYTDPTYIETKMANHKSDIYSFGIVMFELLCGRRAVIKYDQDNRYLAPVATFHYREKTLDDIIDPDLWTQMDPRSLNIFAETAYDCLNDERSQRPNIDEIVTRLEKALELQLEHENAEHSSVAAEVRGTSSSHEEGSTSHFTSKGIESNSIKKTMSSLEYLSHSQLSFKDIQSATNNFQNIIKHKIHVSIYQGRLLHSGQFIDIVVREYINFFQEDDRKFRMEKSILSSLNHANLVSVIGFYDKNNYMLTVYKEANGSLNKYLSDETLTWMQRLKICLGVANALSYIHYDVGRDFSVIHCNIRSSKILLDDKWEPKLYGFELALKNTVPRRHRLLLTRDIVKNVYLDPKYKKTGGVTHKSDVYSFGVVILEVLCGMSATDDDEDKDKEKIEDEEDDDDDLGKGLLSKLAKSHLDDMIMPHLRKEMDPEAFKIFSETTYWCLKEDRGDRPYIDQVVKRFENAVELQWKHENPINSRPPIQLKVVNQDGLQLQIIEWGHVCNC